MPDVLYHRLFSVAWSEIDAALQRMHCTSEPIRAAGVFRISHGTSLGAKLLLWFLRLPPPNAAAPVELIVRPVGDSETWLRFRAPGADHGCRQHGIANGVHLRAHAPGNGCKV
jgi:hypothetical protein